MSSYQKKSLAIACANGSFKGAFAHGVLSALETAGIIADIYAAASSSVLPTAWAAIGKANQHFLLLVYFLPLSGYTSVNFAV